MAQKQSSRTLPASDARTLGEIARQVNVGGATAESGDANLPDEGDPRSRQRWESWARDARDRDDRAKGFGRMSLTMKKLKKKTPRRTKAAPMTLGGLAAEGMRDEE